MTIGNTVVLPTPLGAAEAIQTGNAHDGTQHWEINYPTGGDFFYGSKAEVVARMRKRIAADFPADEWERDPS
jgi:hypothetical protein